MKASGRPDGLATLTQKLMPDGSKSVQLAIEIAGVAGTTAKVRSNTSYGASGEPTRMFFEVLTQKPVTRSQTTVTFDASGARAVVDRGGKREVKDFSLVEAAPRRVLSEFWFVRDMPIAGDQVDYYHFNVSKLEWELSFSKYVGKRTIRLGETDFKCHLVESNRGNAWLDEKGLPVKIEADGLIMERKL